MDMNKFSPIIENQAGDLSKKNWCERSPKYLMGFSIFRPINMSTSPLKL